MANLRFLSVCSGIEAASLAWEPMGWSPVGYSEIDPFPCHVLHHRFGAGRPLCMPSPDDDGLSVKDRKARAAAIRSVAKIPEAGRVPNFGDMTQFDRWPDADVDVLVGGTPCQDYSVAGLRLGMAGSRGQLTLTYVEIAARYRPRWLVWENVPGVLSSNGGRDFARFLGEISGQRIDVPEGGWSNAGIVSGIPAAYGIAYRVLDAQFVRTRRLPRAVPQRRRRVFVVGYLGDWRRAAAVLFDRESLRGNPPPGRKSGQRFTHDVAGSLTSSGRGVERAGETRGQDPVVGLISMAHGQAGAEIGIDHGPTLTCNHEAPIVAHALRAEGFDASEDGTGRGTPIAPCAAPIAFSSKDYGADAQDDVTPTLRAMGHADSHANAGGKLAVAIQERAVCENPNAGPDGKGFREDGAAYTLEARTTTQAVAFAENSRAELRLCGGDGGVSSQLTTGGGKPGQGLPTIALPWAVRRLVPVECERLQGMPDDHTMIPWRGRNGAPDGPRYKALGNSMARNAMEWLGERISMVEAMQNE